MAAARRLLEKYGADGFAMADVAAAVGVRPPSIYGRFATREALLVAVELDLWADMTHAVAKVRAAAPADALAGIARAYRAYAKAHPQGYELMSSAWAKRGDAGQQAREATFAVVLPHLIALAGDGAALHAGRVLTAFLHGFVSMELVGAFRMGGNIDVAFAYGLHTIIEGLRFPTSRPRSGRARSRR
ncbi:MAG TPA: TetR/AcrR family transcriptional regulator [Kofleriaceae bacterium]